MNQTVAFVVVLWAAIAGCVALTRAAIGSAGPGSRFMTVLLGVAVAAWVTSGVIVWVGGTPPARPAVFLGYAVTALGLIPIGAAIAGRVSGRIANLVWTVAFFLLAFVSFRTETVWLTTRHH